MEYHQVDSQRLGPTGGCELQDQQPRRDAHFLERFGDYHEGDGRHSQRSELRALRLFGVYRRIGGRGIGDFRTGHRGAVFASEVAHARNLHGAADAYDHKPHSQLGALAFRAGRERRQSSLPGRRSLRSVLSLRQPQYRLSPDLRSGAEQDSRPGHQGAPAVRQLGFCRGQRHGRIPPLRRGAPFGDRIAGEGLRSDQAAHYCLGLQCCTPHVGAYGPDRLRSQEGLHPGRGIGPP